MMLEFNIRNQEISRIDGFSPAEKSVKYLTAKFNFKTEDWNDTARTATFKNLKTKKEYDKIIEDNQCKVPWEVLEGNSDIEVSVFGVNGAYTITTDVACFKLNRTLSGGSASTEPTPSAYAQYVKCVAEERQKAESAATKAEEFAKKAEGASEGKSIDVDNELSEESTNPVQNKVVAKEINSLKEKDKSLDKEVIALRERNAELEQTVEKLQIKTTTSPSPFHHITDSANMKVLDFGMEGKTEQDVTNADGINLINLAEETVTWTGQPNSTQRYKISDMCPMIKVGDIITFSTKSGDNMIYFGGFAKEDGKTWTVTEQMIKLNEVGLYGKSDTSEDNPLVVSEIMLNKGTEVKPYTPYIEPSALPTPEHSAEIVNAGKYNEETDRYEIECKAFGKNVLSTNPSDWINYNNTYYKQQILALPNTTNFTITVKTKDSTNYPIGNVGVGTWTGGAPMGWIGDEVTTLPMPKFNCVYLNIKDRPLEELLANYEIQVEWGSVSTESLPYTEQRFTLTSPVPITKWDKLVKRDGVWGWSVYSEEIFLKDYRFTPYGSTAFRQSDGLSDTYESVDGYCKYLQCVWLDKNFPSYCIRFDKQIWIYGTKFTTEIEITQWINDNNVSIIHKRKNELAFHPLPDEEQELLRNLETYYGVTNLHNDQGCPMWLEYVNDTKLYVDQKLLEIQQAMI